MDKNYTTWVEISKSALLHNLNQFIKYAGKKAKICPILKSNAYGHGMLQAAKLLQNEPIWGFGVVNLSEALILRKFGVAKPILCLSYVDDDLKEGIVKKIEFSVYSLAFAGQLNKISQRIRKKAIIHLKVDTGTNRLGVKPKNIQGFLRGIKKYKWLKIKGIFSHLADSENSNWSFTNRQIKEFDNVIAFAEKENLNFKIKHIACSAASVSKNTHYNMIRLGISLYGLWPSEAIKKRFKNKVNLKPALSWFSRIIQVKEVEKNEYIGYSLTCKTRRKIKIAVIPVGYWEGYDRNLSNKNFVLIRGKKCNVLGRICMNMHMVDVTSVKNVKTGDKVILIGRQGNKNILADDLAKEAQTINYEIVTRINPLIPRIYV